jgi:transposase
MVAIRQRPNGHFAPAGPTSNRPGLRSLVGYEIVKGICLTDDGLKKFLSFHVEDDPFNNLQNFGLVEDANYLAGRIRSSALNDEYAWLEGVMNFRPNLAPCGMKKRRPYPTDVSDEEWYFAAPYLTLMNKDATQRRYELREMFNALRWIVRAGVPWRLLPNDFPPWETVYQQTQRWIQAGCFEAMVNDLRSIIRVAQ